MKYWLIKSEPSVYSWEQLEKDKSTFWNGIRNYAARNHLRSMKKGDQCFFYHSNEGLAIVGIAKVIREAYQDSTTEDPNWVMVDVAPFKKLPQPVTLEQIKLEPRLTEMVLIKNSRLSVQPVLEKEWNVVLELAGIGKKTK